MKFDYLHSIDKELIEFAENQHFQAIGNTIDFHTAALCNQKIAIIGVPEYRNSTNAQQLEGYKLNNIRRQFYSLFPGNWNVDIIDLGDIQLGNTVGDTYFSVSEITSFLIKKGIIPIIIGGSQDITYANYRAYDALEQTVNIVGVDARFDIGSLDTKINSSAYLSNIVMDKPNNLLTYSHVGYQTYLNAQEEIDLLEKLNFEKYRLGKVVQDISIVEPVMRDADMISFDISSIKSSEVSGSFSRNPNGFTGIEACSIARYAGISDKVTSFGIYEYNELLDKDTQTASLIAQMIWYFIEGVNYRLNEYPFDTQKHFQKHIVPMGDEIMTFYKSDKSDRWWVQVEVDNNKSKRSTLISCTYKDYLEACNNHTIPERWMKAVKKRI